MKRSTRLAAGAFIVGGLTYLASEAIAALGWRESGYSYARNNISDLGIPDLSPLHTVMNTGFIVDGALFVLAGAGLSLLFDGRARAIVLGTSAVHGIGSIIVGTAHASVDGASSLHAVGAGMAIVGGNLVLLAVGRYGPRIGAARWYTTGSSVAGVLGLAGLALFLSDADFLGGGTFERISVYTIIGWEIITGAMLLHDSRRRGSGLSVSSR